MNMFYFKFIIIQTLFKNTICQLAGLAIRVVENNLSGYCTTDCTDIYKEIPQEEFNYITISVVNDCKVTNKTPEYNYYQMEELAKDPNADFTKPTMMFVSGYLDEPNSSIQTELGSTYKQLGFTVLLLNARVFRNTDYMSACRNTRPVGKHTAEMLVNLTHHGLDPKRLSIVGLSLGGQAISFIGKYFQEITSKKVARITGLDPAGCCYRNLGPEGRLHTSDADFVDVIYTNIDDYGMVTPLGHVNFYVNGGETQPGNSTNTCDALCSHVRSHTLWMESLRYPDKFIALKCDSVQEARKRNCYDHTPIETNVLGLNTDKNKQGIFYLSTNNSPPYFLGDEGLKRENDVFKRKDTSYITPVLQLRPVLTGDK